MHPAPGHLHTLSTADLRIYAGDLSALIAHYGPSGYAERLALVRAELGRRDK